MIELRRYIFFSKVFQELRTIQVGECRTKDMECLHMLTLITREYISESSYICVHTCKKILKLVQ
jgi:hypothetical protein